MDFLVLFCVDCTGTKQQLLYKLRRSEKLAELDPIELEKTMLDQEDETFMEEGECEDYDTTGGVKFSLP